MPTALDFPPHPMSVKHKTNGAFLLNQGDLLKYNINGRCGRVDEFLQDGDAYVTWDDGTYDIIKWNNMSPIKQY